MTARRRVAALLAPLLCLAGLGLGVGNAGAATPGEVSAIPVGSVCLGSSIAAAPKEGILVRICEGSGDAARVSLENLLPSGKLVRLAGLGSAEGPAISAPGGEIWVAENFAALPAKPANIVGVAPDGSVVNFPIPASIAEEGREMTVRGLAIGAEGALWAAVGEWFPIDGPPFETSYGGELIRISPGGSQSTFPVPEEVEPWGIALGPDGNLWFTGSRGRSSGEHHYTVGDGYIGRSTPTGAVSLFPTPIRHVDPRPIAAAPAGGLWFDEGGVGTIGVDGVFGRGYELRPAAVIYGLAFDSDGDAWMPFFGGKNSEGVLRLTPAGQQTRYPGSAEKFAVGPEGDVWTVGEKGAQRIVPGGPGMDIWKLTADRATRRVSVHLACGGLTRRCEGRLELALEIPASSGGGRDKAARKSPANFARRTYSLGPESRATVTVKVPAKILVMARGARRRASSARIPAEVVAHLTVDGGPSLTRRIKVPSL